MSIVMEKKGKKEKAKKAKEFVRQSRNPVSIALATYLEECSRFFDIVDFLSYDCIRSLSCANHSIFKDISTSPASNAIWKSLLYSNIIDEFRDYEIKVEKHIRDDIEKHFGCRKVALAVRSNTCSSCGKYACDLNLLDCSRACLSCFMCVDSGNYGADSKSPFALCTIGYAKTNYLLSDSDVSSKLFVWSVDDPLKSHGLISSKIKVVLQNKAKALAYLKFGGEEGLRAEKTARAEKSEKKWTAKCVEAKKLGKPAPKIPDMVQKEKAKDPDHWNFVCANQKCRGLILNSKRYGFYQDIYGTKSLEDVSPTAATTIIVTDATDEMLKKRYAGYEITRYIPPPLASTSTSALALPTAFDESTDTSDRELSSPSSLSAAEVKAAVVTVALSSAPSIPKLEVHDNLVNAFVSASRNSLISVVVDKLCDLRVMKKVAVQTEGCFTLGGIEQKNTIPIHQATRVIGTSNGLIQSDNAIFWILRTLGGCKFHSENLRLEVFGRLIDEDVGMNLTPCFGTEQNNHVTLINCSMTCKFTNGSVALLKSPSRLRNCHFINVDSPIAVFCSLNEKDDNGRDNYMWSNNIFDILKGAVSKFGIFEIQDADGGLSETFYEKLRSNNRLIERLVNPFWDEDYYHGDY